MKKGLLFVIFCISISALFAQKESFDLISYSAPKGWQKTVDETITSYTTTNNKNNTWCRINIVKSTVSKGDIQQDFENEWQEMIVKNYHPATPAKTNVVQDSNGWKIKTGAATFLFDNREAIVYLTTATGYNRCVSVVSTTNSDEYFKHIEGFLKSVDLPKLPSENTQTEIASDDKNTVIGTWSKTGSVNPSYNDVYATSTAGYSSDQYTFHSNGTYQFVSKTFGMSFPKILLVKETGTYQISGNLITLLPQKSVTEAWSKKNGVDKWGSLLSSQKRKLEKTTYQFTKHYFSGIQIWNLVLQHKTITQRDGPHSSNKSFDNAWYYSPIAANNPVIELPNGETTLLTEPTAPTPVTNSAIVGSWGIGTTTASYYLMDTNEGSMRIQYTFNPDGTYGFYIKTFQYQIDKLFLTRETGTYQISGNTITINPKTSVVQAYSKKNNTDNWGTLLSTSKRETEKVTYSYSLENFGSGMVLILKASGVNKRDGPFNNSLKDAWFYPSKSGVDLIKLPN